MATTEELLTTLERMDDRPGWLSGDRELVAQLCRLCCSMADDLKYLRERVEILEGFHQEKESTSNSWEEYQHIKKRLAADR